MKVYYERYNHIQQEINIFIFSESGWGWLRSPLARPSTQDSTGSVKLKYEWAASCYSDKINKQTNKQTDGKRQKYN